MSSYNMTFQVHSYNNNLIRVTADVLINNKKHNCEVDHIIDLRHWKIAVLIVNNTINKKSLLPRRIVVRKHINDASPFRYVTEYPQDMWYILNTEQLNKFIRENIYKWKYKKLDLPFK
jgi:hypothetical protein